MIQRGAPWHKYADKIIEHNQNFKLSEAFGWLPSQIRELNEEDRIAYITMLKGKGQSEK